MPKKTRALTEEVDIMVTVNNDGRIIGYNTPNGNVVLPDELLGLDWRAFIYNTNNGKFKLDPDYVPPVLEDPEF